MMEYLIVWAFASFANGTSDAFSSQHKTKCEAVRLKLESIMVEDGADDGDWISPECRPFTLLLPSTRIQ